MNIYKLLGDDLMLTLGHDVGRGCNDVELIMFDCLKKAIDWRINYVGLCEENHSI